MAWSTFNGSGASGRFEAHLTDESFGSGALTLVLVEEVAGTRHVLYWDDVTESWTRSEIEEGQVLDAPTLRLSRTAFEAIAGALYQAGIRPKELHDDTERREGKLEAQTAHLEDMRRLVFSPPDSESSPQKNTPDHGEG